MQNMNVYDFDGTIYGGDSTVDFYLYTLKKNPLLLRYLPRQIHGFILYKAKKISKTQMKEYFYSFLQGVQAQALLEDFWQQHEKQIFAWYADRQRENDLVISASPEFLLAPICRKLGIRHLLASRVDPCTGRYTGENCRGTEKINRFRSAYPHESVEEFYSDSLADLPLAKIAQRAYLIQKGKITDWKIKS